MLTEIFSSASEGSSTTIKWSEVDSNLSQCENEILCILDTCFAATAGIAGNTELLAATGIGEVTRRPGEKSFTSRLMAAMSDMQGSFNVSMLHGRLCDKQYRVAGGQTPIHIQRSDRVRISSFLPRLSSGPPMPTVAATPSAVRGIKEPRVLIQFTLNADSQLPQIEGWIRYLTTNLPSCIEKGDVSIEGVFNAGSTLVLLALPIAVWDCMPPNPALSFVSFVESHNLLLQLPRRESRRQDRGSNASD